MKLVYLIICLFTLNACSEGDIFEEDINFDAPLERCNNDNEFVFYKIDTSTNTSLSVNFTSSTFEFTTFNLDSPITIALNGTSNIVTYRVFEEPVVGEDYFCANIPPSEVTLVDELTGSNGSVIITYEIAETTATSTTYNRTITLNNITLIGPGRAIRKEFLVLGTDQFTINN
ncbi:hypothetical protein [Aquimarina brevivitae]|uniref:Uncharacterized protein n=1 Tax=Aquimarina brevivitae TaxID=323412 RepID=A0A4Q7NTE5_9FLAO|nr:hypothetical protein [Aquimarina brevivitae]RZS90443.1 hypothetical protein EV197_3428 [Aquimarina brevivitae]